MAELGTMLPSFAPSRALKALVVDDEAVIRGPLALCLETLGHSVLEAATVEEALAHAGRSAVDVALVDLRLGTASGLDLMTQLLAIHPRLKIIIITAFGSVDVAVRAMARGAADFLCKPFTPSQVASAISRVSALRDLEADVGILADRWGTAAPEADFATTSATVQEAVTTARRLAPTHMPLLISGEPGTGKTVLARAIHGWSKTPEGPFVSIDCSARSAAYVDLALFGETVAGEKIVSSPDQPLVQKAAGGTLLIKRFEFLSPETQDRLTQLLNSNTAKFPDPSSCRIIATTALASPDLERHRLFAFLDKGAIALPPLRERALDIPMLAQRYVAFARQNINKPILGFSADAIDHLIAHDWPENLRELRRVVLEAVGESSAPYIESTHLPQKIRTTKSRRPPRAGDPISLRDLESAHIQELLKSGKTLQAIASILDIDLQALYRRRKSYGLDQPSPNGTN